MHDQLGSQMHLGVPAMSSPFKMNKMNSSRSKSNVLHINDLNALKQGKS
jgi:hypothetical protein